MTAHESRDRARPARWWRRRWPWLLLVAWAACSITPRQGWNPDRGPVVPHDTFPADCSLCHVTGDWHTLREDFTFDHAAETGVALDGAHAGAGCLLCHNDRGPVAVFAARGCAGCHVDTHGGALGSRCDDCHTETDWRPREMIARHARTRLPLVGAHAAAACWRCHPGAQTGNFEGLDPRCTSCHSADLAGATSPDHASQGWTTDCQRCHVEIAWQPARFAHPPSFPLTGGHAGRRCADCHAGNVFQGLPADCASCHLPDYQATTNPAHAGFPTTCADCHTTTMWPGARFDHSFPIAGPHARSCNECHTTPNTFTSFSCTHCHEHRQSRMDDEHDDVPGYVWSSPACLQCHPDGQRR